jgi:hypothetical protein
MQKQHTNQPPTNLEADLRKALGDYNIAWRLYGDAEDANVFVEMERANALYILAEARLRTLGVDVEKLVYSERAWYFPGLY